LAKLYKFLKVKGFKTLECEWAACRPSEAMQDD
jgi:hypothetical protein